MKSVIVATIVVLVGCCWSPDSSVVTKLVTQAEAGDTLTSRGEWYHLLLVADRADTAKADTAKAW